jgi:putative hydrolase of the HAD superfamily
MKAIFFDLDETLVDRQSTFAAYLNKAFKELDFHKEGYRFDEFLSHVHRWDDNGYRDKQEAFGRVLKGLNSSITVDQWFTHFKTFYGQDAKLFPNVKPFLQTLKQKYPLALISNGRHDGQMKKLQVTGIEQCFDGIFISESQGVKKPDPAIYQKACDAMSVKYEDVLFVGDHPKNDVETPKQLGMKAIWVRNETYQAPEKHDGIVDSVLDLNNLV